MSTGGERWEEVQWSTDQANAIQYAIRGGSMFLTGNAGTGKSTVLLEIVNQLRQRMDEKTVFITASTGIAACHIGGTTIHSFGGVGTGEDEMKELLRRARYMAKPRWVIARVLIIDEISMLKPELFDALEEIARTIRKSSHPFGGIQVIGCGDFHQLPPVYRDEEVRYCFEAASWTKVFPYTALLKTVHRQGDPAYVSLLDHVRHGILSMEDKEMLQRRVIVQSQSGERAESKPESKPDDEEKEETEVKTEIRPTRLCSHRATAEKENREALLQLNPIPSWKSTAKDSGTNEKYLQQLKDCCQAPEILLMRVGAQVLLLKNLSLREGLCNGTAGIIREFDNGAPIVEFFPSERVESVVMRMTTAVWEIKVGGKVMARREQYPLILGWSVTIHKSQGMTLDTASIELMHLFAAGQGYTALSRVRSINGLFLDTVPTEDALTPDPKVLDYYEKLTSTVVKAPTEGKPQNHQSP